MLRKLILCAALVATFNAVSATPISYPNAATTAENPMAQLPHNVIPQDYVVTITPDVDTMRIAGSETVNLFVSETTSSIQFNSSNQKLAHVLFDGATVQSVQSNEINQITTVKLKAPATIGKHTLSFSFVGQIGNQMHGIFTQPYTSHSGKPRLFLTAQFEGSDTHRIFPCWDNAAFNATYQLNVTVPKAWKAWSSIPVTQSEAQGEYTTISYQKTSDIKSELFEFSNVHKLQVPENYIGKN